MPDFLDKKRAEIAARIRELKPLVDEFHRLESAVAALGGATSAAAPAAAAATPVRRGPGRPRGSRTAKRASAPAKTSSAAPAAAAPSAPARPKARRSSGRRPGRRPGSGARAAETLALVQAQPKGITIPELAAKMGIKQNYLYRVLPTLQKEGKIRKSGRTWYPKAG